MPRKGKSAELARWLEEQRPDHIGEAEFARLRTALAPVSENYLRKLVRECGALLDVIARASVATFEDEASFLVAEEHRQGETLRRTAGGSQPVGSWRLVARSPATRGCHEMNLWLTTG
jgi:hypothetical protein